MPSILNETKKDLFVATLASQLNTHIQDSLVQELASQYERNAEVFLRDGTISALVGGDS